MKVGIDARIMGLQMGGGDTFLRNLVRTLPTVDPETEYTLFLTPRQSGLQLPGMEKMRCQIVGPENLPLRIFATLPVAAAQAKVDVLHAHFLMPPLCPCPTVITLHDISYERYPQFFTRAYVRQYRAIMPVMARRAAAIITGSTFSKRDIVRRYCVPEEKVLVVPYAADPMFRPLADAGALAAVRKRYATGERFILSVGEIQPRKNLKTLIEAYVRLRRVGAIAHKLVMVGKGVWLSDETFAAARASGYQEELVFTGFVPDDDLVALYNAAEVFVYPSLFEGFGLPPLEAMACGTPVITSNTSSLPEVVGDAGLMVAPLDVEGLADQIAAVLADSGLRECISARGLRRVAGFSWIGTAEAISNAYKRTAAWQQNDGVRFSTRRNSDIPTREPR